MIAHTDWVRHSDHAVLGLALMIVGIVLTVTLIAAPIGIPLIIF